MPAVLGFYRKDGQPLTDDDIRGIAQFGAGLYRKTIGTKTWTARADAIIEAESLGFTVVNK